MILSISYNPYLLESKFQVNGKSANKTPWAEYLRRRRLQTWFYPAPNWKGFAVEIQDALNEREVTVEFTGRKIDYEDLNLFFDQWNSQGGKDQKTRFVLTEQKGELREDKNVFQELDKLVETFKDSPVEELRSEELQRRYQQERKNDFDMAVVATMSSGKSTLINALLGCDLLPAANDATTAKITRIHDCDDKEGFTVQCSTRQGEILHKIKPVTPELLDEYNKDDKVFYVDLDGDIPGISGSMLRLNILDTPGPNNSATQEHRDVTNTVLHDKERQPIILYVMDSTKPEDESDAALLKDIAETMKRGGKQTQERFVFVMNKADMLDESEDGKIGDVLRRRQAYLQRCGIDATQIIPVSANAAKLLRMQQKGQMLTKKQQGFLVYALSDMNLDEDALLSPACRAELNRKKEEAKQVGDKDMLDLISTGIIGLELTINEYLEKYAYPYKISRIIDTFKKKLDDLKMHADFAKRISESEAELEAVKEALNETARKKKELEEKKNKINEQTEKVQFNRDVLVKFKIDFTKKMDEVFKPLREKRSIRTSEANMFLKEVNRAQKELVINTQQAMRATLDQKLHSDFDPVYQIIRELINNFKELKIERVDFSKVEGLAALGENLDSLEQEDLFEILNNGEYIAEKFHYEKRSQENLERKGFFGMLKFWKPKRIEIRVRVSDGEYINVRALYDDASSALNNQFENQKTEMEKDCDCLYQSKREKCQDVANRAEAAAKKEFERLHMLTTQAEDKKTDVKNLKECYQWMEQCSKTLEEIV